MLDRDATNLFRAPWDLLTLMAWYPSTEDGKEGRWALPLIDRVHGDSMQEVCSCCEREPVGVPDTDETMPSPIGT